MQVCELTVVLHTAGTYTFASFLPDMLLDGLLNLPHILVGVRNWLLPVPPAQPHIVPKAASSVRPSTAVSVIQPSASTSLTASRSSAAPRSPAPRTVAPVPEQAEPLSEPKDISGHETGSEADVESNNGDGDASGVESSWISLGPRGFE